MCGGSAPGQRRAAGDPVEDALRVGTGDVTFGDRVSEDWRDKQVKREAAMLRS